MQKNVKKKFAYTESMKNEFGFSLLSSLFTLVSIAITLPIIIHLLFHLESPKIQEEISVQQLFLFLRNDALRAKHMYVRNNKLYFNIQGEMAKVEQYHNLIRRQVEGKGHEIYARNIKDLQVDILSYGIRVRVTTEDEDQYEKTIAYY